jgi:bromodomain adjacent to zinc finger domain protein 1A
MLLLSFREFFERTILCNSLVWSCSLSGRSGLTYQEAVESEDNMRKQLGKFPESLLRPILFLVTLHRDAGLNEMIENVHTFIKDRYFIGETVELLQDGRRY